MSRSGLGRVAAAVLVAATGALLAPVPPAAAGPIPAETAAAAACPSAEGVTAVVDFAELGGGVTAGCDPDGGGKAASVVFKDAGYTLEYSQQPGMQGFVCKIQGKPADGDCAQTDRFWSLWWSDGTDGQWHFSNQGVGSLDVPDGGYVAFAWHQGGGDAAPPAVAPTPHEEEQVEPEPDQGDSGGSGNGDASGGGSGSGPTTDDPSTPSSPSASDQPSAEEGDRDRKRGAGRADDREQRDGQAERVGGKGGEPSADPEESGSETPGIDEVTQGPEDTEPVSSEAGDDDSAFPTWVAVVLAVLVLGGAALVPILRRRAG